MSPRRQRTARRFIESHLMMTPLERIPGKVKELRGSYKGVLQFDIDANYRLLHRVDKEAGPSLSCTSALIQSGEGCATSTNCDDRRIPARRRVRHDRRHETLARQIRRGRPAGLPAPGRAMTTVKQSPIKFGTDGWRAIIADEYTFENVRYCAQGTAEYVKSTGMAVRGMIVGYDTRFQSEAFAAAVAEVFAANEIPVRLCDSPAPTPVIGYAILPSEAAGSVVITSSHNPAVYSGFKVRTEYGGAAPPDVLEQIEARITACYGGEVRRLPLGEAMARGLVEKFDPKPPYMAHLGRLLDLGAIRDAGLVVVADPMHGAGAGYLAEALAGGKTRVHEVRGERNPAFPGMTNPEPIPRNLELTAAAVRDYGAQVGLCTDGDADRIGVLDDNGDFVNQLQTYALLAYYMLEVRGERGPLVKSVTTTSMIKRLGELYDVPVHETAVGFKHLGPKMRETDALIAGEESGGFAFRGHLPERDGVLSGLYILDLMTRRGKDLPGLIEEIFAKVGPHFYDRDDITMSAAERDRIAQLLPTLEPKAIAGLPVLEYDRTDGLRFILADGAWALIRLSGTEPLMRIYTEVRDEKLVRPVLDAVRGLTGA
jgi:phosphomannomutase